MTLPSARCTRELRSSTDRRLPWEEVVDGELAPQEDPRDGELSADLANALGALEDRRRRVVLAVYVEGKTYAEAVEATGIPLGSLRRYLREALAQLGRALATSPSGGAPFAGPRLFPGDVSPMPLQGAFPSVRLGKRPRANLRG